MADPRDASSLETQRLLGRLVQAELSKSSSQLASALLACASAALSTPECASRLAAPALLRVALASHREPVVQSAALLLLHALLLSGAAESPSMRDAQRSLLASHVARLCTELEPATFRLRLLALLQAKRDTPRGRLVALVSWSALRSLLASPCSGARAELFRSDASSPSGDSTADSESTLLLLLRCVSRCAAASDDAELGSAQATLEAAFASWSASTPGAEQVGQAVSSLLSENPTAEAAETVLRVLLITAKAPAGIALANEHSAAALLKITDRCAAQYASASLDQLAVAARRLCLCAALGGSSPEQAASIFTSRIRLLLLLRAAPRACEAGARRALAASLVDAVRRDWQPSLGGLNPPLDVSSSETFASLPHALGTLVGSLLLAAPGAAEGMLRLSQSCAALLARIAQEQSRRATFHSLTEALEGLLLTACPGVASRDWRRRPLSSAAKAAVAGALPRAVAGGSLAWRHVRALLCSSNP
jgi:hypothetical protein